MMMVTVENKENVKARKNYLFNKALRLSRCMCMYIYIYVRTYIHLLSVYVKMKFLIKMSQAMVRYTYFRKRRGTEDAKK